MDLSVQLNSRRYDPTRQPTPDQVVIRINDKKVGSLQNLVTLTGKQKNGKSRFLAVMIAAGLTGNSIFNIEVNLPLSRPKIALFDTEQGDYDFYRQIEQIKRFGNFKVLPDHFDAFTMREDQAVNILKMISAYLELNPDCGLLFLDGILDCLLDFNNVAESKRLTNFFKKITKKYNVLMVGILHRGKGNDTTIGNIGSMSDRLAQSVLKVEKNKETSTFSLSSEFLRSDEDFDPINILWNGNGWIQVPNIPATLTGPIKTKKDPIDIENRDHQEKIHEIFRTADFFNYDNLIQAIKEIYGSGRNWAVECIKHLREENIIFKTELGYTNKPQKKIKYE